MPLARPPATPTLEPRNDPAERQADELGIRIARDLDPRKGVGDTLGQRDEEAAQHHLGVSLDDVSLDATPTGNAQALNAGALALTEGKRIAFATGELDTTTFRGRALLGHELVHVGQQLAAGYSTPQGKTDIEFGSFDVTLESLTEQQKLDAIRSKLGPKAPPVNDKDKAKSPTTEPRPEGRYKFSIAEAWDSFGSDLSRVAKENGALWRASLPHLDGLSALEPFKSLIATDVIAEAKSSLEASEKLARSELALFEPSEEPGKTPTADKPPTGSAKRIRALQDVVRLIKQLVTARDALRSQDVDADGSVVRFDPLVPPESEIERAEKEEAESDDAEPAASAERTPAASVAASLPEEGALPALDLPYVVYDFDADATKTPAETSVGPSGSTPTPSVQPEEPTRQQGMLPTWSDLRERWDTLDEMIADLKDAYPSAYALFSQGLADKFLTPPPPAPAPGATPIVGPAPPTAPPPKGTPEARPTAEPEAPAHALNAVVEALNATLGSISRTRTAIDDGTLKWSDFEVSYGLLLTGQKGASGTDWTSPAPKLAAKQTFETAHGGGPIATLLSPVVGPARAANDYLRRGALEDAKRAAMSPDTQLTERGEKEVGEDAQRAIEDAIDLAVPFPILILPKGGLGGLGGLSGAPLAAQMGGGRPRPRRLSIKALKDPRFKKSLRAKLNRRVKRLVREGEFAKLGLREFGAEARAAMERLVERGRWHAHHFIPISLFTRKDLEWLRIAVTKLNKQVGVALTEGGIPLPRAAARGSLAGEIAGHLRGRARNHPKYNNILADHARELQENLLDWGKKRGLHGMREIADHPAGVDEIKRALSALLAFGRETTVTWVKKQGSPTLY